MKRRQILRVMGAGTVVSVAGCTQFFGDASSSYQNGTFLGCSGDTYSDRIEFNCERFDGAAGRIFPVEAGSSLDTTSRADIEAGSIRFLVKNPADNVLWEYSHDEPGTHEQQTSVEADDGGRYEMRIEGSNIQGSFTLRWQMNE